MIPIHLKSSLGQGYLSMINYVSSKLEAKVNQNPDVIFYKPEDLRMIYTLKAPIDEVLEVTGWNVTQFLHESGWNGEQELKLYIRPQHSIDVTVSLLYVGRSRDLRESTYSTSWFHQILPDKSKPMVTFAFTGAIGYLLAYHRYLLNHIKNKDFGYNFLEPTDERFLDPFESFGWYKIAYMIETESMFISDKGDYVCEVPGYAYEKVKKMLTSRFDFSNYKERPNHIFFR